MTTPDEICAFAESVVARLRIAEQRCGYVNPHKVSASLPVVLDLAETVAALAVLVADLKGGD